MPKGRRSDFSFQRHPLTSDSSEHLPRRLYDDLVKAQKLIAKGSNDEAQRVLEDLNRQYPDQPDVLGHLINVNITLDDALGMATACEQLLKTSPRLPEPNLTLAGAFLKLLFPQLALRQFRHFLKLFPTHPSAAKVREEVASLETLTQAQLEDSVLKGPRQVELGERHERAQLFLSQRKFAEGRRESEVLIREAPTFVPAHNNLSLLYATEGRYADAINCAKTVLSLEPQNLHALSNLIRFYVCTGQVAEARSIAGQLKAVTTEESDPSTYVKKAEAFSFMGDDLAVLAEVKAADGQDAKRKQAPIQAHFLWHLGAVAAQRRDDTKYAKTLWKRALALVPGFDLAQQNLDDLARPIAEQSGAWPYSLGYWLNGPAFDDLSRALTASQKRKAQKTPSDVDEGKLMTVAIRQVLDTHPEVRVIVPILFERGDPQGRALAMVVAGNSHEPELDSALLDFITSCNGPDKMRLDAGMAARQSGLLSAGTQHMWVNGQWSDVHMLGFEITPEPVIDKHTPRVNKMHEEALAALWNKQPETAERLLKEALALDPESPDLLNNLSSAYEMQDRNDEAHALLRDIHRRFPDYLFARTALAFKNLQEERIDEAQELLRPLMLRTKFHTSEFSALAGAQFGLFLLQSNYEASKHWLEMLERVRPDDRHLPQMREQLQLLARLQKAKPKIKATARLPR